MRLHYIVWRRKSTYFIGAELIDFIPFFLAKVAIMVTAQLHLFTKENYNFKYSFFVFEVLDVPFSFDGLKVFLVW